MSLSSFVPSFLIHLEKKFSELYAKFFHLFIYLASIAVSLPLTLAIPSATPSQSLPLYFLLLRVGYNFRNFSSYLTLSFSHPKGSFKL